MRTKGRCVRISQFLLSISHIEIQGRRANDIKHSPSWQATQVFLEILLSRVPVFTIFLRLCWFAVSVRNQNSFFFNVYFQNPRSKVLGEDPFKKFKRVIIGMRGVFSYLRPLLNKLHFGLFQ